MAVAIVVCIWIYNVAFNIPIFMWTNVRRAWTGGYTCYPLVHPVYSITARIINFYVPLAITWTSYVGIIYKFKRSVNKAVLSFIKLLCLDMNHVVYEIMQNICCNAC